MPEAVAIAKQIVSGEINPNEGCDLIGKINDELGWPEELLGFGQLAHEQHGHEHLGITAENSIPDIIKESKKLIAVISQQGT